MNGRHDHTTSVCVSLRWSGGLRVVVPEGSPSRGGDVKVCVLDINQPSLPTPFTLFLCLFLSYGPFTCISFHKFSRQLSVFSLCSPSLISALLVLSTTYLFLKVSLNGPPKGGRGCLMSPPLSGISGLSFDSALLSPLLFFCLVLLPFLSYRFLPAGPCF